LFCVFKRRQMAYAGKRLASFFPFSFPPFFPICLAVNTADFLFPAAAEIPDHRLSFSLRTSQTRCSLSSFFPSASAELLNAADPPLLFLRGDVILPLFSLFLLLSHLDDHVSTSLFIPRCGNMSEALTRGVARCTLPPPPICRGTREPPLLFSDVTLVSAFNGLLKLLRPAIKRFPSPISHRHFMQTRGRR